jgi:hypothetical protein
MISEILTYFIAICSAIGLMLLNMQETKLSDLNSIFASLFKDDNITVLVV